MTGKLCCCAHRCYQFKANTTKIKTTVGRLLKTSNANNHVGKFPTQNIDATSTRLGTNHANLHVSIDHHLNVLALYRSIVTTTCKEPEH